MLTNNKLGYHQCLVRTPNTPMRAHSTVGKIALLPFPFYYNKPENDHHKNNLTASSYHHVSQLKRRAINAFVQLMFTQLNRSNARFLNIFHANRMTTKCFHFSELIVLHYLNSIPRIRSHVLSVNTAVPPTSKYKSLKFKLQDLRMDGFVAHSICACNRC